MSKESIQTLDLLMSREHHLSSALETFHNTTTISIVTGCIHLNSRDFGYEDLLINSERALRWRRM